MQKFFQKFERRYPGSYVSTGTVRIYYEEFGSGPPLLLIHGLSGSGKWWGQNVHFLAQHFHVYVVDLMGFGRSRRQPFVLSEASAAIAAWINYMHLEKVTLMGHSMGGFISIDLAANHPEAIERLVLVDAAGLPMGRTHLATAFSLVRVVLEMPFGFWPILLADALRAGPRTLWSAAHEILSTDVSTRLNRIQIPTLIVWGERDWLVPLHIGEQFSQALPTANLMVVPNAGHNPMWDQAAIFNQIVVEFLYTGTLPYANQPDQTSHPDTGA